jgi:sulfoacetaldehyde dehydrogenase
MSTVPAVREAITDIALLVERAAAAQAEISDWSQERVDELVTAVAWAVSRPDHAEGLARQAVDEGGFGSYTDKVVKIRKRVIGALADMLPVPTVGVVEEDPARGLVKIAKPVGVVAALIPMTGPDATPPLKAMFALKGRNAIVIAAHPRTQRSSVAVVEIMRQACRQVRAPADLVQIVEEPSIAKTQELMEAVDLVVATGGASMVKAAYSSGTPAYGVGVGNSVHVVDETADVEDAADAIVAAKTFDLATSCLADNAVVAHESIAAELMDLLVSRGGHHCTADEKRRLQQCMWPDGSPIPSLGVIAQPAPRIAELAGFDLPEDRTFLVVDEHGVGADHPFSGEKLSVVLAFYTYAGDIGGAIRLVNGITAYQGLGHTCGIHSRDDAAIEALAMQTRTARVLVNQNLNEGAGSARNGLPFTLSLSCGTWGGNITTENINARHFVNLTWVSRPTPAKSLDEEELFGRHWERHGRG